MKIQVMCDLHLEFCGYTVQKHPEASVLVLAGDIIVASKIQKFLPFLYQVAEEFDHVIMVAGNHEFYNSGWTKARQIIKDAVVGTNIHFLDDASILIDDVLFVGSTLWTDFNGSDPLTKFNAASMMSDYRLIKFDDGRCRKLTPSDVEKAHCDARRYIDFMASENPDKKVVVVTHHSPSFMSVAPQFQNDDLMNGCYHSDLSQLIIDRECIKLWIHGHTHSKMDYLIGQCRVVCNPRGYPGESTHFNEQFLVEV